MRKLKVFICSLFLFLFTSSVFSALEPEYRFGIISRLITAILSGENYAQPNTDTLSEQFFQEYIKVLDPSHLYFTKSDIKYLKNEAKNLYTNVCRGDTSFAFVAYNRLFEKVKKREEYSKKTIEKEIAFEGDDTYLFDRSKVDWANSEEELDIIWDKKLKNDLLTFRMMDKITLSDSARKEDNKKIKPHIKQQTPKERTLKRLKTYRLYLKDNEPIDVLEIFLSTLARLYDPHSSYMSPRSESDFNAQMQLSFVGIGALLSSEDGYIKVERVLPGGPAEKSGVLKAADKIIAVGEEGVVPVDVIDMPISKVVDKIRGEKGSKVYLTILEGSGSSTAIPKIISMKRDTVELKDSEATSEIREIKAPRGGKKLKLGIITLPSFYLDFLGANRGDQNYKSSTRDVKKILLQFNKEKIDGIIVDLRSNGGGSLKEAIDLTRLFIKKGPVVLTKDSKGNISVESEGVSDTTYSGPLIVLVNKLSASAAEIFAGAIQDYKRGIIVGDRTTHGKGTVQTVVDLSTILSKFNLYLNGGAVKLTNAKFYRVSGGSTQNKGVIADIQLKSLLDYMDIGENSLEHAMPWDSINAAKYTALNGKISSVLPSLKRESIARVKINPGFKNLNAAIELYLKTKDKKSVSLNEKKRWKDYQDEMKILEKQKEIGSSISPSLKTDTESKKDKDIYLDESVNILADYIEYTKNSAT